MSSFIDIEAKLEEERSLDLANPVRNDDAIEVWLTRFVSSSTSMTLVALD